MKLLKYKQTKVSFLQISQTTRKFNFCYFPFMFFAYLCNNTTKTKLYCIVSPKNWYKTHTLITIITEQPETYICTNFSYNNFPTVKIILFLWIYFLRKQHVYVYIFIIKFLVKLICVFSILLSKRHKIILCHVSLYFIYFENFIMNSINFTKCLCVKCYY